MKGMSVNAARLTELGLEHDRRWMVVRSNGRFLTQRDLPRLALITPSLTESGIRLALPGAGEVVLEEARTGGSPISSKVWDDPGPEKDVYFVKATALIDHLAEIFPEADQRLLHRVRQALQNHSVGDT